MKVLKLKNILLEGIDLPIEIGDTVKMGKFKNKKVVIKKIDWNEKGDLLINGRPALKFRLMPKTNIFDKEEVEEEFGAPAGILPGPSRKAVKKNKTDKMSGYKQINENDKAQLMKLYTKAMKMMPHSPAQKKVKKQIDALRKKLKMNEGTSKIKKVIAIYPGRFQPFGPHHKKVYLALKKKFGDVYIVTSNIQKPPRHPMNFKEKAQHMTKMGIPSNKIIMDNPYKPVNLLKKFKPEETAAVFAVGEKDKGRLSAGYYFDDYNKNKNNLKGYKEHGYVLKAPHISVNIAGKEVSGTTMRKILSSPKIKPEQRKKLFKLLFGYFNGSVYNMMIGNFKNV